MITVAIRTSETTITFRKSFSVGTMDRPQPAGTYRLVMDDDEVPGVSFVALRRIATFLHTPALSTAAQGKAEVFHVSANELAAALDDDGRMHLDGTTGEDEADRQAT
jgi:hypothetical protein